MLTFAHMKSRRPEIQQPVRTERMGADRFVALAQRDAANIARARFIPPVVGSRHFGRFEVQYKTPVLRPLYGR